MNTPTSTSRRAALKGLGAGLMAGLPLVAAAAFPDRPITIYVPNGPGSAAEAMVRIVCDEAARQLGQPLVIENRPGGMFRLGLIAARNAPPDGYTLAVSADTLHVMQPLIDPAFKMNPGKDHEPIAMLFSVPLVLIAHSAVPVQDMKGLIAYSKANPGKLNLAVVSGSTTHFATLLLKQKLGLDVTIVPYKSQAQFVPDLMTGRIDLTVSGVALKGDVEAGRLKALATMGETRWNAFPQTPNLKELGLDIAVGVWYGVVARAGTPADVITRLNNAFRGAMRSPAVKQKLAENFLMDTGSQSTPREFRALVDAQVKVWEPVLRSSALKLE